MTAIDFLKNNKGFESKGLPEGDTFVKLSLSDIKEEKFLRNGVEKTSYLLSYAGKEWFIPKVVLKELKKQAEANNDDVRITRQGLGQTDTRYTVVGVNKK